jgi:hypothetical protein
VRARDARQRHAVKARDPRCCNAAGHTHSTVAHVAAATAHADAIAGCAGRCFYCTGASPRLSAVSALPASSSRSSGRCLTYHHQPAKATLAATPAPPRGRPRCVIVCIQGHGQRGAVD